MKDKALSRKYAKKERTKKKIKIMSLDNNLERLFDPKYDARPAIKKTFSVDNFER